MCDLSIQELTVNNFRKVEHRNCSAHPSMNAFTAKNTPEKKMLALPICIYSIIQVLVLFLLRKLYLLTVYQTVAFYGAIVFVGIALIYLQCFKVLKDAYIVCWSGIHGTMVLGFLTYGAFNLTLTQITWVQIVNLFLGVALYWIVYMISGTVSGAIGWGNLVIGILGTLNFYLVKFRGAPFQLSDIKASGTAVNVAQYYDFTPSVMMVLCLLDLILWYGLWRIAIHSPRADEDGKERSSRTFKDRWTSINIAGTILVAMGCVALSLCDFGQVYARTQQFTQENYLAALVAEVLGSSEQMPEDYTARAARELMLLFKQENSSLTEETEKESQNPHLIIIMNEAFSDLRVLGELETTQPVLEYWDSLEDNVIRGWTCVSVLGGTTANSEYEFLTSDPTGAYAGAVPYNKYFARENSYPGLVSVLKEQGYETTAFHPYHSSGWNRMQVYRAMQFDHIIFQEDLDTGLDTIRYYVSDRADYGYIMDYFEQRKGTGPRMFFNVTMQNHGGYTYDEQEYPSTVQLVGEAKGRFPQTEQYLTLMKESDAALEELLNYFRTYDEPVIVVLFGDHQPRLEDGFYEYVTGSPVNEWSLEQRMNQYKTPFIIWHNYEAESKELGEVSLNYLASIMMESAGLEMSDYQRFSLEQYKQIPVISTIGLKTSDGQLFGRGETDYSEWMKNYRTLVYNHTVDKDGRWDDFFQLNCGLASDS